MKAKLCVAVSIAGIMPLFAFAADLQIDGFASFVAGQVIDDKELNNLNGKEILFSGYGSSTSYEADSLYAIQFHSDLKDGLSATAQVVAEGNQDFDPDFKWAFISYVLTPGLTIKAGRSRAPLFLYSDTIDVGYAYPWISPPYDVYIIKGIDNITGVNFQYEQAFGDWVSRLNLVTGDSNTNYLIQGESADIIVEELVDFTWNLSSSWFTFQLTHATAKSTIDLFDALADALANKLRIPLDDQELDALTLNADKTIFSGVGISIDVDRWLAITELTNVTIKDAPIQSDRTAWYTTLGYRWKDFTYHLTYIRSDAPVSDDTDRIVEEKVKPFINNLLPILEGQPALADELIQLNTLSAALPVAYQLPEDSHTWELGLRYNFHNSAAFKLDYQTFDDKGNDLNPALVRMGVDVLF